MPPSDIDLLDDLLDEESLCPSTHSKASKREKVFSFSTNLVHALLERQ
jgi:hypothetical protein